MMAHRTAPLNMTPRPLQEALQLVLAPGDQLGPASGAARDHKYA